MLRRLRLGFAILAVLLWIPMGLLIARAFATLERERDLRHAAVATRVFDELERELGDFLRREEQRPAADYRRTDGSESDSPLAVEPLTSFVLGYFQVDHTGDVQILAEAPGHSRELSASVRRASRFEEVAVPDLQSSELESPAPGPAPLASQGARTAPQELRQSRASSAAASAARARAPGPSERARARERTTAGEPSTPGSTRPLQTLALLTDREQRDEDLGGSTADEARESAQPPSSYRVLKKLGEAAQSKMRAPATPRGEARAVREEPSGADRTGVEMPEAKGSMPEARGQLPEAEVFERDAFADAAASEATTVVRREAEKSEASEPEAQEWASPGIPEDAPTPFVAEPARRLALAPSRLSGEPSGPSQLLLYRTAFGEGSEPCRQGLVVDLIALGDWLAGRVLPDEELRESLTLEFAGADQAFASPLPENRFVYAHRFREPFDALQARLAILPLGDSGGDRYIGWMTFLLAAASSLGLWAIYRFAATSLHFAERRANFAAAVSHELKTPLTAIRMYAEMLRDGLVRDPAKRREYYETISSESERLTRLIHNVLEWSKLEKQARATDATTGSIETPVREVLRIIEPHARAEGFELTLQIEAALPPVRHDPDVLQQILFNLIDNALKYGRGEETARVEVACTPADAGVVIRVRDHGPGVPAKQLPLIFEAFYRGVHELTRTTRGTGIGLALVRGLAAEMQAKVTARNHPDGGLEVEVYLAGGQ